MSSRVVDECKPLVHGMHRDELESVFREMFKRCDTDHSGFLDRQEFTKAGGVLTTSTRPTLNLVLLLLLVLLLRILLLRIHLLPLLLLLLLLLLLRASA
jgi:hypothetical protein